jgi:hypothetical protein|tara:strand:- start:3700 stop:4707 length:1008 start_codon:yes stop_codon:yes gene_type:complete
MAVPKQVQKQTEAVQELYKDLNSEGEAPSPEGEAAPPVETTPVQEVEADSVKDLAPQPDPVEPGEGSQDESFEQKYKTLQGMYNADTGRLSAQNQELGARMQQMEQLISNMQASPAPVAEPEKPASLLTEDEVEEYGESIDIMRKVSQEIAGGYQQQINQLQAYVQQLQGQVVPRVEQIANAQAQGVEQSFWSALTNVVPNWREINDSPEFKTWLLEIDPLTNMTRQTYLNDAQREMDVTRVANFFVSWLQANGTTPAQPNRNASNSELAKQVAPGKGRFTGTPQGKSTKTYTPQDITDFFRDVRDGKFKGEEEKRDRIEHDIFAAQQEGRIVNA